MSHLLDKPKSELTQQEAQQLETHEINHGPLSLLKSATESSNPVIISLRNNHKLIAQVKAFDRHSNMVLENVKEVWSEQQKITGNKGKKSKFSKPVHKERFVSKMFLRGDSIIVVFRAPI